MIIQTERLIIRTFCREDLEPFIDLIEDKMQSPFKAYGEPFPTDKATVAQVLG